MGHPSLHPWSKRTRAATGYAAALVAAALLHLAIVPLLDVLPAGAFAQRPPMQAAAHHAGRPRARPLEVEIRQAGPPKPAPKPPPPPHEDDPVAPGQVVRLPPSLDETTPDRADYAAETSQRVERESRARVQGLNAPGSGTVAGPLESKTVVAAEVLAPAQSLSRAGAAASAGARGAGRADFGAAGADASTGRGRPMFELALPRAPPSMPARLRMAPDGTFQPRAAPAQPNLGDARAARLSFGVDASPGRRAGDGEPSDARGTAGGGDGSAGLPTLEALTPSAALLARASGLAANDDLPNVEVDAATRLNAWRWKHSQFFNRMGDALNRTWRRGDPLRAADPTGQRYGFEDRLTVLSVTLDRRGEIVAVNIAEPSGVVALDDDAIATFHRAAPFANPPDALFRGNETFTFQFGFSVGYDRSRIDFDWRAN